MFVFGGTVAVNDVADVEMSHVVYAVPPEVRVPAVHPEGQVFPAGIKMPNE